MSEEDYFAEGYEAGLAGLSETENPHDPDKDPDAYMSWNDGWNAGYSASIGED